MRTATYAASTVFEEPIAPGIWTAGLISAVIGHAVARSRGDLPVARSEVPQAGEGGRLDLGPRRVLEVNRERNRIRLRTVCTNQRAEDVLTG